jgi:hypothetical protein
VTRSFLKLVLIASAAPFFASCSFEYLAPNVDRNLVRLHGGGDPRLSLAPVSTPSAIDTLANYRAGGASCASSNQDKRVHCIIAACRNGGLAVFSWILDLEKNTEERRYRDLSFVVNCGKDNMLELQQSFAIADNRTLLK